MDTKKAYFTDGIFSVLTLFATFFLNLSLQQWFQTQTLIPMIFVLGVFMISWRTQGYFWGIAASLISVLTVNYAFTYPYYVFDLISPECVSSAIVMLIVSIITGTLRKEGYDVKNGDFFKIGIPFTLSAIVPAYILIWILFGV